MIRKKAFYLLLVPCWLWAQDQNNTREIATAIDQWHEAAAAADFDAYFGAMTDDAVFIGTDASENWQKSEFMEFARPYFEKGKAWDFKAVERHIYLDGSGNLAWFDELLDTWMKICRGSGVVVKENGKWKIAHYVLSIAVPNDEVTALVNLKKDKDSIYLKSLKSKQ